MKKVQKTVQHKEIRVSVCL